ncbi:MAG: alpha/beta hydrolase [Sandaracinaceae bacterium]|nr:alpha/beta hydrolase [Sandaracinaceae bacterium]
MKKERIRVDEHLHLMLREEGGNNDKEGILFIHGWMVSGAVWNSILPFLDTRSRRLLLPDLRGAGESDCPPGPYDIASYGTDLWRLADRLGIERLRLIGHSMGGQIALWMAGTQPNRVSALCLICPVPPQGINLPEEAVHLFRTSAGDRQKQGTILDLACKALPPSERERLLDDAKNTSPACIEQSFNAWRQGGFQDLLHLIQAKTVVLATDDPFLPPPLLNDLVVTQVKRGRLVYFPGVGHYPQCEAPQLCAAILNAFLAATDE